MGTVKNISQALMSPQEFFKGDKYSKSRPFVLMLIYVAMILLTSLASQKVMSTEGFREFQIESGYKQALKMNPSLTDLEKEELRDNIRIEMEKPYQRIIQVAGSVIGAFLSIISILIFWIFLFIFFRFAGAEESPVELEKKGKIKEKKHRRSLILTCYAFIPIGLSALFTGILLLVRDPDYYLNMLTLQDIMDKMNLAPSLYSLFFDGTLPLWPEVMLNIFTNPFYWWFVYIIVKGGEGVLRVTPKKSLVLTLIYLVLLGNYQWGTMLVSRLFAG